MTSLLLITTNPHQSIKTHTQADSNHPDTLWIDNDPITIDIIRTTHRFAATPPLLHPHKYIVVLNAHLAKIEAQNALLKLLEEPPAYLTLVLTTHSKESLLETIRSRCQEVYDPAPPIKKTPDPETTQLISALTKASPAQQFLAAGSYTKKAPALKLVSNIALNLEHELQQNPSLINAHNLRLIQQAADYLNQNVNPQAVIEHLFSSLDYPHT